MGIVTTICTALGGFEGVIWTEVLQAALMLFAPLAIIWFCLAGLPGGFGSWWRPDDPRQIRPRSPLVGYHGAGRVDSPARHVPHLHRRAGGRQPLIQRIYSAPLKEVRRVNATFTISGLLIGILAYGIGITIFAYFPPTPDARPHRAE